MTPTSGLDPARLALIYEEDARRYCASLPLEHFMESTTQSTQRKITLESFDLIQVIRPDVQCFSELLVQYLIPGSEPEKPRRVVPDNMVIVHPEPIRAAGSFMVPLQPVGPLLVLEYVSKSSERKDYDDNYDRYEQELKVPYYLVFYPDNQELSVFRLAKDEYATVLPNDAGRLAIPELELEAALLEGWVRFWFRGDLLPLPGDLLRQRDAAEQRATTAEQRASSAEAEVARLREELARAKGGG